LVYPSAFGTPRPEFKSQQPHSLPHHTIHKERLIFLTEERKEYTKYEKARIIGARALQIAMGAPVLIETDEIDPITIAIAEFEKGVVPITVRRSEG
jgi:DNA-directed RNA polymerase subunit K